MPITTSAQKALRQSKKRQLRNLAKKEEMKRVIKEYRGLLAAKKSDETKKMLPRVYRVLDKAAKTGIIKKNNASRKKARLSRALRKLSAA